MSDGAAQRSTIDETGIEEIASGVFRLNMPLPFRGLKQVNLWLLYSADGWTMIDCGFGSAQSLEALENAWKHVLGGKPLARLVITHFHPDHMGNAGYVARRWKLRPMMTQSEWLAAHVAWHDGFSDDVAASTGYFHRHGLVESEIDRYREGFMRYRQSVDLPETYRRIRDGEALRLGAGEWQVITGAGHAPDLATFYSRRDRLYIAGDQVLPKISPNISVYPHEPDADPISDYIASLARIRRQVSDDVLVLPSHKEPFRGLHERIDALGLHHAERLTHLKSAFTPGRALSAADAVKHLFPFDLDGHQIAFAMGEAIAHLNHLRHRGDIAVHETDDRILFELSSSIPTRSMQS